MGALLDTEAKTRVHAEGGVFGPMTPEQFTAFLTAELQKNAKAIRDAGLNREWSGRRGTKQLLPPGRSIAERVAQSRRIVA